MKRFTIITSLLLLFILLGILSFNLYQGTQMKFQKINMLDQTPIPESKQIICEGYHQETISTYEEYTEFISACYIDIHEDYDEIYFTKNVLVVYQYHGAINKQPKQFYDSWFGVEDIEVINYATFNYRLKATDESVDVTFLIEADRKDIRSNDVIFDKIY
jgi:hypothetical protein